MGEGLGFVCGEFLLMVMMFMMMRSVCFSVIAHVMIRYYVFLGMGFGEKYGSGRREVPGLFSPQALYAKRSNTTQGCETKTD